MKTYSDIVQSLQELAKKNKIQANHLRNKENKLAGFFNVDYLTHIDDPSYYEVDDNDIQDRINHYKKLLELQDIIMKGEDEINCIKSWKNLGVKRSRSFLFSLYMYEKFKV